MDKALLRKTAMQSVALMIAVVVLSYSMNNYHTIVMAASSFISSGSEPTKAVVQGKVSAKAAGGGNLLAAGLMEHLREEPADIPITDVASLKLHINEAVLDQLGDNFLAIRKPKGGQLSMELTDLYIKHSIRLDFSGVSDPELTSSMVYRVRGDKLFKDDPLYTEVISYEEQDDTGGKEQVITRDYGEDLSHGITIATKQEPDSKQYSVQLLLELDTVYAYTVFEDSAYYYISLKKPSEAYDKILVIDPGHGGKDAGAVARNNKDYEKDINLGIALELKKLLDQQNIKVYYTRTGNDTVFLRPRSNLANAVDCDYFISIHCNSNSVSYPNGTEVLFHDARVKGVSNRDLADLFSEELSKAIPLKKKGSIEKNPEDIFIMGQAKVPMVLLEVGYLSNSGDLDYLLDQENQKAVAQGIYNGILRAYEELPAAGQEEN
ncbi:MAG TPA: N-acetylmuramoyl-L-alanine amidase [Clostridiales bacterium]|nr:N-acetylmuramoyl-L-alanine amidase [Clostridiales bacterium]